MQSVPITTNVVVFESLSGEVCLIQHYVIKFVWVFSRYSDFSTNKPDRHAIIEILLKVDLNTITLI